MRGARKRKRIKAEVTVFLSMLFVVILLFVSALIQSSSIQQSKTYSRAESELAIQSMFAEYHKVLLEEFDIFAIEGTYETGVYSSENLVERFGVYATNQELEISQMQLLTDSGAISFKQQMIAYVEGKYGLDSFTELFGEVSTWEEQRTYGDEITIESEEQVAQLVQEVGESEGTLDTADNPLENLSAVKSMGILQLVVPDGMQVSSNTAQVSTLPSNRTLMQGINSYQQSESGITDTLLISEYLLDHYKNMVDAKTASVTEGTQETQVGGLQYEIEYILEGGNSDKENLEGVVNKLLVMRTAVNYSCLQLSVAKKAEVSALALSIATASGLPLIQPVLEQTLLLGWAYGESIIDIRSLLSGNRVELVKTDANWQLDLEGLMTLGQAQDLNVGQDVEAGLNYENYLKILLCLESQDSLVVRGLDMIEQRMNLTYGYTYFQVDYCITQLQFMITDIVSNDYVYAYPVAFTYH